MSPLTFQDKLKMVGDVISSSPLYTIALFIVLILVYLFGTTNSTNQKQSRRTYLLIYLAVFFFLMVQYGKNFTTLIDYAVNQVFVGYYFPNIVLYIIMLLIATIITLVSIFHKEITKTIKVTNSIFYGFLVYFLVLILSLINNLKLDVFEITELYSSDKVRSILELSMFLFVIWMVFLITYHFIRRYQEKHNVIKKEEFINYNIIHDFKDKTVEAPKTKTVFFEQPVVENTKEEPFTLEEYKMMLKVLKEEQMKEQIQEKSPLTELNKLYQSVEE